MVIYWIYTFCIITLFICYYILDKSYFGGYFIDKCVTFGSPVIYGMFGYQLVEQGLSRNFALKIFMSTCLLNKLYIAIYGC